MATSLTQEQMDAYLLSEYGTTNKSSIERKKAARKRIQEFEQKEKEEAQAAEAREKEYYVEKYGPIANNPHEMRKLKAAEEREHQKEMNEIRKRQKEEERIAREVRKEKWAREKQIDKIIKEYQYNRSSNLIHRYYNPWMNSIEIYFWAEKEYERRKEKGIL